MTVSSALVALVLLALAAAVSLLFAMVAELNARIPLGGDRTAASLPSRLEEAKLGASPTDWPSMLSPVAQNEGDATLLVLSPSCSACESVGSQLSSKLEDGALPPNWAVVVPCSNETVGRDFIARHGLDRLSAYVDLGGEWIGSSFGIQTSPSALRLRDGTLESAVVFNTISTLETLRSGMREDHLDEIQQERESRV
ncbi:hypothetical protein [Nocardioides sp.]|uniref:hypothetical protein n=1 Tax=Nocardioides sp. TaxID=35761 RepID=UPI002F3E2F6D